MTFSELKVGQRASIQKIFTGLAERARRIISVAHPAFRQQLTEEAIALGILPRQE